MKGGTYAEAIKVGFTPEQSGLLARFGAELRTEIADEVIRRQNKQHFTRRKHRADMVRYATYRALICGTSIAIGIIIGKFI